MLKQIPNALTLLRLVLAPVIAWLIWLATLAPWPTDVTDIDHQLANWLSIAALLFVVAALTDLFDGMLARALDAHSKFGRIIDPIADKALVGLPLAVIAWAIWQDGRDEWPIVAIAVAVIVARDLLMTLLRLVATDGEGARVSSLAKWKTALELIVVGWFLIVCAIEMQLYANGQTTPWGNFAEVLRWLWIALLVLAATLSAYTAYQYLAPKPKT